MATNTTSTKNKVKGPSQTAPAGYKGKNQAFLDAEYLSARYKKTSIEDVISVGVIITNPAHEELDRFYSTVQLRPGHKLPPLITELTGLTNEDLEDAPAYEDVMTELIMRIRKFQVGKICVWGGDKQLACPASGQRGRLHALERHDEPDAFPPVEQGPV